MSSDWPPSGSAGPSWSSKQQFSNNASHGDLFSASAESGILNHHQTHTNTFEASNPSLFHSTSQQHHHHARHASGGGSHHHSSSSGNASPIEAHSLGGSFASAHSASMRAHGGGGGPPHGSMAFFGSPIGGGGGAGGPPRINAAPATSVADYLSDSIRDQFIQRDPSGIQVPTSASVASSGAKDHSNSNNNKTNKNNDGEISPPLTPQNRRSVAVISPQSVSAGGNNNDNNNNNNDNQQQQLAAPATAATATTFPSPSSSPPQRTRRRFSVHQDDQFRKSNVIETISVNELDKMKQLFDAHDLDHSGSIDDTELLPLLEELGHPMEREQAVDLLSQVDVNGNGLLEFSEFLQLVLIFKNVAQFRLYEDHHHCGDSDSDAAGDGEGGGNGAGAGGGGGAKGGKRAGGYGDIVQGKRSDKVYMCGFHVFPFHHESTFLWAWEVLLLAVCVYIWCSVTSVYAYNDVHASADTMSRHFDGSDIGVTVIIALEMFRQSVTSFRDGARKDMVTALSHIAWNYVVSAGFICDLLSLLPMRLLVSSTAGADAPLAALVVAHFRLLFLWHLQNIMGRKNFADIDRWFVYFFLTWAPPVIGLAAFLCTVHVCAIASFNIGLTANYAEAVYVVLYCFSGAGFGDVEPSTEQQRAFLSVLCLMSMLVNGFVIGSIVSFFATSDVDSIRKGRLVQTLAVLDFFEVPRPLQEEILQFQNHLMSKNIQAAFAGIVESLPNEMKVGLGLQIRIQLVRSVELFRMAHPSTQIALAQELFTVVLTPEEFVCLADEEDDTMFFISYGFVDLLTAGGVYIKTLKMYESFGAEVVLGPVEDAIRNNIRQKLDDDAPLEIRTWGKYLMSAKTLTYVELLGLNVPTIDVILRQFPRFRKTVEAVVGQPGGMGAMFGIQQVPKKKKRGKSVVVVVNTGGNNNDENGGGAATNVNPLAAQRNEKRGSCGSGHDHEEGAADSSQEGEDADADDHADGRGGDDGEDHDGELVHSSSFATSFVERRHSGVHKGDGHHRAPLELRKKLQELNVGDLFGDVDDDERAGTLGGAGDGDDDDRHSQASEVPLPADVREQWLTELERIEVTLSSAVAEAGTTCHEVVFEDDMTITTADNDNRDHRDDQQRRPHPSSTLPPPVIVGDNNTTLTAAAGGAGSSSSPQQQQQQQQQVAAMVTPPASGGILTLFPSAASAGGRGSSRGSMTTRADSFSGTSNLSGDGRTSELGLGRSRATTVPPSRGSVCTEAIDPMPSEDPVVEQVVQVDDM